MKTEAEIKAFYKEKHDRLTENYYAEKDTDGIPKERFDELHGKIWQDMQDELITLHYVEKGRNWKQEYSELGTTEERLALVAERLDLK